MGRMVFPMEDGDSPVANCQFFQRANDAFFGVGDMKNLGKFLW